MTGRTLLLLGALGVAACGGLSTLDGVPPIPAITAFTATPPSLPADGGTTTLAWTVTDADTLSLAPGIGNVGTLKNLPIAVDATTTYTLTASNSIGQVTASVTVTVGP